MVNSTTLYLPLLDSTLVYHASTSPCLNLHYSTVALLHSTSLYNTLPWLYLTLLDSIHYSTMTLLHSAWLYISLSWHYFTWLDSTLLYHCSTSLYLTIHYSTMAILHSPWLYITLPWLYFTLYITLSWLHFALLDSTLLHYMLTSLARKLDIANISHWRANIQKLMAWIQFVYGSVGADPGFLERRVLFQD